MTSPTETRRLARRRGGAVLYVAFGVALAGAFVAPLFIAALRSLQSKTGVTAPLSWDMLRHATFENYAALLGGGSDVLPYARNSLLVATSASVVCVLAAAMAGYVFARYRFRGVNAVLLGFMAILMVPFQALVIPLLSLLDRLGLSDSWVGLVLVHATYALPLGIFILRNTFLEVPRELEESARIDGCNGWQSALHVLRPLVLPGIVSSFLFAFLFSWTEFLGAVTFLSSQRLFTLPVQLLNLQLGTQGIVNYGYLEAGAVIAMLPCLVLYLSLQRYYVAGLISGSVKG